MMNKQRSTRVLVESSTNSNFRLANHNALTKILHFCALDVRDGMCDWALNNTPH